MRFERTAMKVARCVLGRGGRSNSVLLFDISGLVNLERLAHILKSLDNEELETLELLLDNEAAQVIFSSVKELKEGKGVPIEQW